MPPIVEQVAKGNRKAMLKVYESNKRAVYILCRLLLKDETGASAAFTAVINELWSDLSVKEPGTEDELRRRAMELAVKHCKRKLFGKEQNQFKVAKITPVHQPEVQKAAYSGPVEAGLESLLSAISQMEVHQRFVYLAIAVGGLSVRETGKIVGQRENVVKYLYELGNFALYRILSDESGAKLPFGQVDDLLRQAEQTQEIPCEAEQNCLEQIKARSKLQAPPRYVILTVSCICLCAAVLAVYLYSSAHTPQPEKHETQIVETPEASEGQDEAQETGSVSLDPDLTYYADIEMQDYGTITVELDQDAAPITTANFVSLAESGFYDGLTFHRIIDGFMMQGGDPNGDGTGGSGQNIEGEFSNNGYDNPLSHTRGAVSMARSSDYNSASSQFFIVQEDASESLDGDYAVFGYVTEGMDIVDEICQSAQPTDGNGTIPAAQQPVITTITIRSE